MQPLPPRHVVLLATPMAHPLEIAGSFEVFALAEKKLREAGRERSSGYQVELVSIQSELILRSASGLAMVANRCYTEVREPIDTLLVTGGLERWTGINEPQILDWLRKKVVGCRRWGSICTGAFLLAEAGLLDGHRVTTHWYFCQQLQEAFPLIRVDPEPIYIQDGALWTSAGVTAGIDMALALVEEDYGADIAMRIARSLVLFLRRSAGQSQFSTALSFQASSRIPLRELPIYIMEHLDQPLSIDDLAERVMMSRRNFSRVFKQEFGETPMHFVEGLRLETAVRLLKESDQSLAEIATSCGFGTTETLRRGFLSEFNKTPGQVRDGE